MDGGRHGQSEKDFTEIKVIRRYEILEFLSMNFIYFSLQSM